MLNRRIILKARIIANSVERAVTKTTSEIGLTSTQTFVLGYIHRNCDKTICQRDIENNFGIKHPTATGILSRLEEKGLIECLPSSRDRRYKIITETEKALSLHNEIQSKISSAEENALRGLSEEEISQLGHLLDKVIANVAPESLHPEFSIKEGA